jgi:hypothetical protein
MKAAGGNPVVDCFLGEAELAKLPPGDDGFLAVS